MASVLGIATLDDDDVRIRCLVEVPRAVNLCAISTDSASMTYASAMLSDRWKAYVGGHKFFVKGVVMRVKYLTASVSGRR